MNILLTTTCSRRCPYCFAQERVTLEPGAPTKRTAPPHISREDFSRAIEFAKTGAARQVGILGGEPSLHPQFTELLELAWDAGFHTKIFSNGMWRERDLDALATAMAAGASHGGEGAQKCFCTGILS